MRLSRLIAGAVLVVCAATALADTPAAEPNPGFEEISSVAYDGLFADAVQLHHAGHKGQAFAKFMRLACGGDKVAQEQIGQMYLVGEGAAKNTAMAYLWLKTAAEFNFGEYRALAKKIEGVMTPEQAKRFNQLADEMIAQYGQRATNVTCSLHSASSFSSNIKNTLACSPKRAGGGEMYQVQRCYQSEENAIKSVLASSP